ncbi:hypothetical protein M752DRAFT_131071 [Aspergillus phoenicis ATCC 13157]|uniref:Uncharacterized protein n=1 Tax=Aspergillus phoenicis ATCC 13157 TaxID=1353007 RepID=A0A370PS50_ASPPH|nr:hypothetical protein M752DRAFT_131071 [Aspergillus phoenicis ATCC 13157]
MTASTGPLHSGMVAAMLVILAIYYSFPVFYSFASYVDMEGAGQGGSQRRSRGDSLAVDGRDRVARNPRSKCSLMAMEASGALTFPHHLGTNPVYLPL